ncbi:Na+/H+ antiporter NhaC family protein [Clostridium tarantellae]|uniref:Na+/H+ antiporter NhaC family protein n=1 Tax=Clostridium tarantellae TaxID=39493 RepID=A0A6I1MN29_9CLOT|nr:Na+/H+ antiporter NhaC family protein [Clostridium tarantellae]MPQ44173.1 Na+/H+ antiporter NhaC family protein [Clostridium tarantellae]
MKKKGSVLALLPLLIFVVIYIGVSLILKDFYAMSVLVPGVIAALIAIFMKGKKESLNKNLETFCKGAGNSNIILMCFIFILAGAFAEVAKTMGAVESTVNLGLSILPSNILIAGMFIIASFIAISLGTSMGTIAAIVPIAMGIAEKTGISLPLIVGAVVGGAMFGDNLSMISDTTIAATKTQGCKMRDKFKTNFKVILPAAIITIVIYTILGNGVISNLGNYEYSLIKVIPYVGILIAALLGINVILVLSGGIFLASSIGFFTGTLNLKLLFNSISTGIIGMSEIIIISLLIGGIVELTKENGGIDFILNLITSKIKSKRGAEIGIGILVSLVDICTANNTIAIVTVGPIAKDISDKYELDSKRIAGILDMFSCSFQGIIPYGAQLLSAASLTALAPFEIMKFLFYPYLMGISALIFITLFSNKKSVINKYNEKKAILE